MGAGTDRNSKIVVKRAVSRHYGRNRVSEIQFDLAAMGFRDGGLFALAIRAWPDGGTRTHLPRAIRVAKGLVESHRLGKWAQSVLNTPPEELGPRDIVDLFMAAEEVVYSNTAWTEKYTPAFLFRQLIAGVQEPLSGGSTIRQSVSFKTRFTERTSGPRGLLSDHWDPGSPNPDFVRPATQIEHDSFEDLHDKALAHLEYRTKRVTDAAISVLEDYQQFRQTLEKICAAHKLGAEELRRFEEESRKKLRDLSQRRALTTMSLDALLAAYVQLSEYLNLNERDSYLAWSEDNMFWRSNEIRKGFAEISRFATNAHGIRSIVVSRWYLPPYVVAACAIYVIARTGWNPQTVLNLRPSSATPQGDGTIEVTSLKERSDEFQNFFVEKSDKEFRNVLDELQRHQANLSKYWGVDPDGYLFTSQTFRRTLQPVLFNRQLPKFIEEFHLPQFQLSELRDQDITHVALKTNDPEIARIRAGHGSLAQTDHYLSTSLLRLLSQANINEFERRFGATAYFLIRGGKDAIKRGYKARNIDEKLLVATGIGTACKDPKSGPPELRDGSGHCRGYPCDGCHQHAIAITKERIREAILARHYYRLHGHALVTRIPGVVDEALVAQISFNFALCEFIRKSEFGKLFAEIEASVAKELRDAV